jgi:S-ribosylhomocysteine lyase LuxS involved in autoinducer biosynthesis
LQRTKEHTGKFNFIDFSPLSPKTGLLKYFTGKKRGRKQAGIIRVDFSYVVYSLV